MTYASTGLIQAADFNTLCSNGSNINDQWGVGTGAHGLGQTAVSTLAAGATVTAAQWSSLLSAINSCLSHEGQATITPAAITAGSVATYYSAITTGSAAAYTNSGTTGLALTTGTTNTTSYGVAWGNTGSRTLVFTQSLTFTNGDAARYFFNAGGKISLTFARSGGTTTRNTETTALATACGTITIGYKNTTKTGGSGTVTTILNANNGGYWGLTGTAANHFLQYDGVATYSTNYIQVQASWSGTASNGGSPVLNINTIWGNAWVNAFQPTIDGTCSTALVVNSPSTTNLTNSWGTPLFAGSVTPV
jgi:hypothetical protein